MGEIPSWKETEAKILNQGVSPESLAEEVTKFKAKMAQFVKNDDLLYYMLAQQKYKISMPKVSTLDFQGGETQLITLSELKPELQAKFVKVRAFVTSIKTGKAKDESKGKNCSAWLLDSKGGGRVFAGRDETADMILGSLKPGYIYEIEGLGVRQSEASGPYKAKTELSWGKNVKAEKIKVSLDNLIANAASLPNITDGQPCFYRGLVMDDKDNKYLGCAQCRKSMKKNGQTPDGPCKDHPAAGTKDYFLYKATISDGNSRMTLEFGSRGPKDSLLGNLITAVGTYSKKNSCIDVDYHEIHEKLVPKHEDIAKGTAPTPAPRPAQDGPSPSASAASAPKVRAMSADEALLTFVQKPGRCPRVAVEYKLREDCKMSKEDIEGFLELKIAEGIIKQNGTVLEWIKG